MLTALLLQDGLAAGLPLSGTRPAGGEAAQRWPTGAQAAQHWPSVANPSSSVCFALGLLCHYSTVCSMPSVCHLSEPKDSSLETGL